MSAVINPAQRVALYARVSTEEQREGHTIDSQVSELERFARERGWIVAGIYKDDGWSGSLIGRPELDRLRDDARKQAFQAVLVNDVDRLARDVAHLGIIKRDLERHAAHLVFRKLPSESSPTRNLMVNILGSFAEFERELIADRTRRGKRHKVEVRKEFLGCIAAYGFRYRPADRSADKDGVLEINPEEASVVRQMYEWIDSGGLSSRQIVSRLNERRIPPRKKGSSWQGSSVLRILHSEIYAGVWHFNKFESCEPKRRRHNPEYVRSLKSSVRPRPRAEWLPVLLPEHLHIIDRSQWQRVQEQLRKNRAFSPRNSKHEYLLKGLIQCGGCKGAYVGDPVHGKFYYRCHRRCKQRPSVKEEALNDTVWDALQEIMSNPEIVMQQVRRRALEYKTTRRKTDSELPQIQDALTGIAKEESRILDAYRVGVLQPIQLAKELEKINARRASLETRREALSSSRISSSDPGTAERTVYAFCETVGQRLRAFQFDDKQRFIRLLIRRIVFEGDRVRIRGAIPPTTPGVRSMTDPQPHSAGPSDHRVSLSGNVGRIENMETGRHGHNPTVPGDPLQGYCGSNPTESVEFEIMHKR